jgi:penicillin-insensitive murein endopeptidase
MFKKYVDRGAWPEDPCEQGKLTILTTSSDTTQFLPEDHGMRKKSRRRHRSATKAASLIAAATLLANQAPAQVPDWGQLNSPTLPPAHAIGSTSRGCLAGGEALPLEGPGWQVMRPSRHRYYGHPELIAFIERLAADAASMASGILIGDMAMPRGGPMPTGHRSHQIGLDVDIWFLPAPPTPFAPLDREEVSAISMVTGDGESVDPTIWTPRQAGLLERAALDPQVDRIFVNPAIKRVLCQSVTGDRGWLGKIRPWWGHDDHFHVRLSCPTGEDACVPAEPIATGDGCDAALEWWFSAEAKEALQERMKIPPKPLTLADLPAACRAILGGASAAAE